MNVKRIGQLVTAIPLFVAYCKVYSGIKLAKAVKSN